MILFENLNDFVQSAIVLLLGGMLCAFAGRWLSLRPSLVLLLFLWHTLLACYYADYVLVHGGDPLAYYDRARFDYVSLRSGTEFIIWMISTPVSWGMSYWAASMVFNVVGALGLTIFYATLQETGVFAWGTWFEKAVALVCLFIPSLSFWTSGIGKDAIALLSVALFLWASLRPGVRQPAAIVAVLAMFAVRPHIAAAMVVSFAAGTLLVAQVRGSVRFGVAALATGAAVLAVPFALAYSGTTEFGTVAEYIIDRQEHNLHGGSSIDITGMNLVLRFLSFLYRPLPNEAVGFDQLAASIDNLVLIGLTVVALIAVFRAGTIRLFRHYSIALIYGFGGIIILSQVTANLGLAARQKWMFVPALMLVTVGALAALRSFRSRPRQPYRHLAPSMPET